GAAMAQALASPQRGQRSAGAAAPGGGVEGCWCSAARVAPETLARLPEEERGRRCVCARCAGA
ncbi:MAG TPA: cysteine-rich CWC family protein, partial [Longimicrobiaceae bacterium]|nr:cysteine-rich CWC family protein [Longimicrobiaceae bacterium]